MNYSSIKNSLDSAVGKALDDVLTGIDGELFFHEHDFQFQFAWRLKEVLLTIPEMHGVDIRMEQPYCAPAHCNTDIVAFFEYGGERLWTPIELKHKTTDDGGNAHYDFLHDICRIEARLNEPEDKLGKPCGVGYAIMLTDLPNVYGRAEDLNPNNAAAQPMWLCGNKVFHANKEYWWTDAKLAKMPSGLDGAATAKYRDAITSGRGAPIVFKYDHQLPAWRLLGRYHYMLVEIAKPE